MKQKGFYVESRICNALDNTSGKVKRALLLVQQEEDKQGENAFPVGRTHSAEISIKSQPGYFHEHPYSDHENSAPRSTCSTASEEVTFPLAKYAQS
jgi:hypothetical protein